MVGIPAPWVCLTAACTAARSAVQTALARPPCHEEQCVLSAALILKQSVTGNCPAREVDRHKQVQTHRKLTSEEPWWRQGCRRLLLRWASLSSIC